MTERRTSSGLEQIRILHLYDEYLNIYADRGNIMVLQQRCAWRDIACHVTGLAPGETFTAGDYDLIYVGGGQDRDQRMIAQRMVDDCGNSIVDSVESGAALLAVCGGYQLLGHSYRDTSGEFQPGAGLFDLVTEAGASRYLISVAPWTHRQYVSQALKITQAEPACAMVPSRLVAWFAVTATMASQVMRDAGDCGHWVRTSMVRCFPEILSSLIG